MTNKPIWTTALRPTGGWAGLWNHVYGEQHAVIDSQNIRRAFGGVLQNIGRKPYNAVIRSLVSGNLGDNARKDYTRVMVQDVADFTTLGGKRTVVNKPAINRATTQADIDAIVMDLDFDNSPKPWPVDKGNGGGGRYL